MAATELEREESDREQQSNTILYCAISTAKIERQKSRNLFEAISSFGLEQRTKKRLSLRKHKEILIYMLKAPK